MMFATEVRPVDLNAISADVGILTAGRIENAAGDAGILLSGTKPGGWVRGLDLTATASEPFLFHDALSLNADGSAEYSGLLTATNVFATGSGFFVGADLAQDVLGIVRQDVGDYKVSYRNVLGNEVGSLHFEVGGGGELSITARADLGFFLDDGSTNEARAAGVVVSTSAASGDYPEGTFWARV